METDGLKIWYHETKTSYLLEHVYLNSMTFMQQEGVNGTIFAIDLVEISDQLEEKMTQLAKMNQKNKIKFHWYPSSRMTQENMLFQVMEKVVQVQFDHTSN